MTQSLFNSDSNESYTSAANDISDEIMAVVKPILEKHARKYSTRELQYVAQHAVLDICLMLLLDTDTKNTKDFYCPKCSVNEFHVHCPKCSSTNVSSGIETDPLCCGDCNCIF